ncbi:MAG: cryptochrome/photolyase family protein [Candidatus Omnitrophica bacterium]|nr:(6-4) photolyase [bacterium]MBW7938325.1 cryptochrome/photolyase family protein [Candidatus Omnitrophota bacterium]MCK6497445.1 cryptochrome/photolyase family protein [bacterium]NUP94232.1 cryptochrome/photolyase family protein [Candidatus Omnitrophota bacterium]
MVKRNSNGKTNPKKPLGIWIQASQLNLNNSLFNGINPKSTALCLIESLPTFRKYRHHKKRIILTLSLLRHFVEDLRKQGFRVVHYSLDDAGTAELCAEGELACLKDFVQTQGIGSLRVMEATEYDPDQFLKALETELGVKTEIIPNDQFMVNRQEFAEWFNSADDTSMEAFYRKRRRETGVLMQEDQPLGGRWNYDAENRVPPTGNMPIPDSPSFPPDAITQRVIDLVEEYCADHRGSSADFDLPVSQEDISTWLQHFLEHRLRLFGMYQDAMLSKSHRMYHSFLSPYFNHGVLLTSEVLRKVEDAYDAGEVPINSAEGFIRQVMGWREYLYCVYWMRMPEFRDNNFLEFHRPIPKLLNDGDTHLKCLACVVQQSQTEAYAHHIQRLMVVGNFALLIGIEPMELLGWMMETYIDAAEWAAVPNVLGMTLYADGGQLGSKPYAASAHYTDKMSDYCKGCYYRERKRVGEKACPFNYLYWNFVGTYQEQLKHNPRMQTAIQMYRHKSQAERTLIASSSKEFLERIDQFGTDRKLKKKVVA